MKIRAMGLFFLFFLISISFTSMASSVNMNKTMISYGTIIYPQFPSQLKVDGSKIIDINTNLEVKLRGFQLWGNDWIYGFGDREPYAPQWVQDSYMPLTQEHMNQIKRWGFNVVHAGIWWTGIRGPSEPDENQPQVYNEKGLAIFLELIRMAHEAGLYFIVEVRVCFDSDYTASGNYPWFGWSTHDYVVFNQMDKAGQNGLDRFSKYLEWLTQNVCNEPNVVGIEPWHFPYHRQEIDSERISRYFNDVVPTMIQAMRKHTNKIIFLSPPGLGHFNYNNHPGPFNDPNIVYDTGGYGDYEIVSNPDAPSWDYNVSKINHPHSSWRNFRDKYNVPIMSTEGPGIAQHSFNSPLPQDRLDLFEAVLIICDDMSGWIVHQYTASDGAWGILQDKDPNKPGSEGTMVDILKKHIP